MRIVWSTVFLAVSLMTARADDPAAALEAKGAKLRKDKAGIVREVSVNPDVTMTLDDYRTIGSFKNVQRVWMNAKGLPLDDASLAALGPMDSVETFFANGAKLTDAGFRGFVGWTHLKQLGFDHWGWFETPDKKLVGPGLAQLAALPNLEAIRLGGCRVGNPAAAALAQIKTLRKVDLGHTAAIDDAGIAELRALPKLTTIILSPQYTPRITDRSLQSLAEIPTLEDIQISETLLTYADGYVHLKSLPNLKSIKLTNVVSSYADVGHLKSDLPKVAVTWTKPDEKLTAQTIERFAKRKSTR